MMRTLAGTITEAMPLADAEFSVEIDPNEIDEPASPRWPRSA
jgi:coproporphyrinogen III oxidase-like Fe-S oxidoreductase